MKRSTVARTTPAHEIARTMPGLVWRGMGRTIAELSCFTQLTWLRSVRARPRLRESELLGGEGARTDRRALDAPDHPGRVLRATPLRPVPEEPRNRPQHPGRPA